MRLEFLQGYSGQTVDELLALEGAYRIDSLVLAFEQALDQKAGQRGEPSLSAEERIVLAVEALEREVNNGGYYQFFLNSSRKFAPTVVQALVRIRCPKTAEITQRAIDALHLTALEVDAIDAAIANENSEEALNEFDDAYYKSGEDIAGQLFAFIKAYRNSISF